MAEEREKERGRERERMSSRRETRDSEDRRHRLRSERESSPKRLKLDERPAAQRPSQSNQNSEHLDRRDRDQSGRRRFQDAAPSEAAPEASDPKNVSSHSADKRNNAVSDGMNHSSDPTEIPRSQTYFQHDERGSAGKGGRSFNRRDYERGRRPDRRDRFSDKPGEPDAGNEVPPRNEMTQDDRGAWRHDGFLELQSEVAPLTRKRPAFREEKREPKEDALAASQPTDNSNLTAAYKSTSERQAKGDVNDLHGLEKLNRQYTESSSRNGRGEMLRDGRQYGGGGNNYPRGRERFNPRHGSNYDRNPKRVGGIRVEKWKHDLYDEANTSPTKITEEEQIAKVEALLAI